MLYGLNNMLPHEPNPLDPRDIEWISLRITCEKQEEEIACLNETIRKLSKESREWCERAVSLIRECDYLQALNDGLSGNVVDASLILGSHKE